MSNSSNQPNYKYSEAFKKLRERLNNGTFVLNKRAEAILMGTVLGDGNITRRAVDRYRFKVGHTAVHSDYTWYKYRYLKPICMTTKPPQTVTSTKLLKGNTQPKPYTMCFFESTTCKFLGKYFDLFYQPHPQPNGTTKYIKTITPKLIAALPKSPYVLAILFLDDGSVRDDCYAGRIALQGFTKPELVLLQDWILKNFKIQTEIHVSRTSQRAGMSVPARSFGKLAEMLELVVKDVPSMEYKLNKSRKPLAKNP